MTVRRGRRGRRALQDHVPTAACQGCRWAGFPIVDVGVEADDGKYHDVDSASVSFQLADERACVECFVKASEILLESFVDVVIHVPERFSGEVAGSLSANRGRLSGVRPRPKSSAPRHSRRSRRCWITQHNCV